MAILPILRWPDLRLRRVCAPVGPVTDAVRGLAQDMLETMYAAPGRGLAGPQVGAMIRIFVMDAGWKDGAPDPCVVLDPVILDQSSDMADLFEGCLSIPGPLVVIRRPAQVRLGWRGLDGAWYEAAFSGFAAACVQHEFDHLNGVVTLDRLAAPDRAAALSGYAA